MPYASLTRTLSFQKSPREEEEEEVEVSDQGQGPVSVGIPEQADSTPSLGPLSPFSQHLSCGEPGLQPGALQVTMTSGQFLGKGQEMAGGAWALGNALYRGH